MAREIIGTVAAAQGKVFARNGNGKLRELKTGDVVFEGETLVNAAGARVEIDLFDGNPIVIATAQEMTLTRDLVAELATGRDESAVEDESIEAVLAALAGDGDIGDALPAPAAGGNAAASENAGLSWVRLARIVEQTEEFAGIARYGDEFSIEFDEDGVALIPVDAVDDEAVTQPGEPVVIDVSGNDTFIEGAVITGVSQPANGQVAINVDGTVTYTPNPGFHGEDTFTYTATSPDGTGRDTATVTVTVPAPTPVEPPEPEPEPVPEPTLSINDVTVVEGGAASLTISLSGPSDEPVTVRFASADDSATVSGGDYDPETGTITFAPGTTEVTVSFVTNADNIEEATEQFLVNLSNATNATIADPQGVVRIVDGTEPPASTSPPTPTVNNPPDAVDDSYNTAI
ncbi:MAG: retention module-containing protein, partial [Parahaliea sp.]